MKKSKNVNIKATLTRNRYPGSMKISGEFTEEQIKGMRNNIGRDFIIGSANNSLNLKYFDTIIFEEIKEIN